MDASRNYNEFVSIYGDSLSRYLGRIQTNIMYKFTEEIFKSDKINLNHSQFHCLQSLCLKGVNQNELAAKLGITKQALSKLVKGLEDKKLISKEKDSNDSRNKIIKHTKKGLRTVSKIIDITTTLEKELMNKVGTKRYKELKQTLNEIECILNKKTGIITDHP